MYSFVLIDKEYDRPLGSSAHAVCPVLIMIMIMMTWMYDYRLKIGQVFLAGS